MEYKNCDNLVQVPKKKMEREPAIAFADQLRSARLAALADAEAFDQVIQAVERLGIYLSKHSLGDKGQFGSLGKYSSDFKTLIEDPNLAANAPDLNSNLLTSFEKLYYLVKTARNDALHQGAAARHLTKHAIELALIVEDSLRKHLKLVVSDFMVRNPVYAELWQQVGFVRQQMLAGSYSYLPVAGNEHWSIVSDVEIARFLGLQRDGVDRTTRLASTLEEAQKFEERTLHLTKVEPVNENTPLADALERLKKEDAILLVWNPNQTARLVGVLTAFDLL